MKKRVIALISILAVLLIAIPSLSVSGADISAAKEVISLYGFDQWTAEDLALCEKKNTVTVAQNTTVAEYIPTGCTSSLDIHSDSINTYFRVASATPAGGINVFPDGLTGFDGIAFWVGTEVNKYTSLRIEVGHLGGDGSGYFAIKVSGGASMASNSKGYMTVSFANFVDATTNQAVAFDLSKVNYIAVQGYGAPSADSKHFYFADLKAFRLTDTIVTTKLQAAITEADALDESDYTPDSWAAFQSVIDQAEALVATPTTQLAVNQMTTNLKTTAIDALVAVADKTALKSKIDEVKAMSQGKYSNDSWAALQSKLAEAETLNANLSATQTLVDTMVTELTAAKDALVELATPDLTAINAALAEVEALNGDRYTVATWSALQTVVTPAKAEIASSSKTQQSINEKLVALNLAKGNLSLADVDKTALQALITEADKIEQGNKTPETWNAFAKALADAKTAVTNSEATQKEVDVALQALLIAKNALKDLPKADKSVLKKYVEAGRKLKKADYVETTWSAFDKALKAGETVLSNEKATESEINDAKSAIINAWNKLKKYSYLELSTFDFPNLNQFDAQQVSKENISIISSNLPSGFSKGVKFKFDATGKGWASISPYGENLEDYPSLVGYDTVEYFIKIENATDISDCYLALGITLTGEAFNLYNCKKPLNASSTEWQKISFPASEFTRHMGTGGMDYERYNIIVMGVHSYGTGTVSITGLRGVKTVSVQAPVFTSDSNPATPVDTGEAGILIANASVLLTIAAAFTILFSLKSKRAI